MDSAAHTAGRLTLTAQAMTAEFSHSCNSIMTSKRGIESLLISLSISLKFAARFADAVPTHRISHILMSKSFCTP